MTETQSTRTGRKTRCHPGKHPGMLYIVTRDRGGRDDVMRKSPIDAVELDDLENDDITEEETKRAEVDAASCNHKLPKHIATWADSNRPG